MAAFPFGGHITLGKYIAWAINQGCTTRSGVVLDDKGKPNSVTQIFNAAKDRWVTEIGTQHNEYIVPTTIARFDRRLGITSPFFSIDAPELDEDQPGG
jgi:hypothetical protein